MNPAIIRGGDAFATWIPLSPQLTAHLVLPAAGMRREHFGLLKAYIDLLEQSMAEDDTGLAARSASEGGE